MFQILPAARVFLRLLTYTFDLLNVFKIEKINTEEQRPKWLAGNSQSPATVASGKIFNTSS